jgi:hypothetical protein
MPGIFSNIYFSHRFDGGGGRHSVGGGRHSANAPRRVRIDDLGIPRDILERNIEGYVLRHHASGDRRDWDTLAHEYLTDLRREMGLPEE